MPGPYVCPVCQREFGGGPALRSHLKSAHPAENAADEDGRISASFGTPRPKRSKAKTPRSSAPTVPVNEQIAMLYTLGGQIAADRGLPATGTQLKNKSAEFGRAWDNVLRRFPALYDMLEKGMVAGDVMVLVWLHYELMAVAREELARRAEYIARQSGVGDEPAAA
jgi:phytoene dehydrogenase-like protein